MTASSSWSPTASLRRCLRSRSARWLQQLLQVCSDMHCGASARHPACPEDCNMCHAGTAVACAQSLLEPSRESEHSQILYDRLG